MAQNSAEERLKILDDLTAGGKKKLLTLYREKNALQAANKDTSQIDAEIKSIEDDLKAEASKVPRLNASQFIADRKTRTHHLCQLGRLLEKAGWGNESAECILGMLLDQKTALKNMTTRKKWEELGKAELASSTPASNA